MDELTANQWKAIHALIEEPSVAAAARKVGFNARTLFRWLEERAFRRALQATRRKALALASVRLQRIADRAPDVLEKILDDPQATPATRVRAVASALQFSHYGVEVDELEERVAELEQLSQELDEGASSR